MTARRRRRPLLAVVLVAVVLLSGCSALLGDDPLRYTATEAALCGSTAAETGYVVDDSGWRNVTREVEVAGSSRTMYVENYLNGYVHEVPVENGSGTEPAGGVAVLSTPQATVAGQPLNPVGSLSARRLVEEYSDVLDQYGDVEGLEETGSYDVRTLETETTVTAFAARGRRDDESVPVRVHVARVAHAGDYVVVGAVHERGDADERRRVERLFGCIGHSGDAETEPPQPSVSVSDQQSAGQIVTVDSVSLPDGGFVVVHAGAGLEAGNAVGSVVGTSQYLSAGQHADVRVVLDSTLSSGSTRLVAMPHEDTDGDAVFGYVSSNGQEDEPYVLGGAPVTDDANVTVPTPTTTTTVTTTTTTTTTSATPTTTTTVPTSTTTTTTTTTVPGSSTETPGQPGFGAVYAVASLLAVACLVVARRR